MPVIQSSNTQLKGLSFSLPELILVSGWAEARSLRMVVRLEHGSDSEEYEEVLALCFDHTSLCHWIMWRNASEVFVQPLIGPIRGYRSVAEAFEAFPPKQQQDVLTDIEATSWPAA